MTQGIRENHKKNTNSNNVNTPGDDESSDLPIPPDGGWGWMVVFASFMIHIITDGITYSFGIFYVKFLEYFGEGKGYTAWIASIMVGMTFCSGPISSSFVNRYGCRAVTIAGAIFSGFCIFISMFAENVMTLIFTIGIGTGIGFGLIYLPAIVSVTMYFEKYRSLATGIAVCGSGFGTFLFAPFTDILVQSFGWRGALMIIAAIVLNCIIFGAMFRPLEPARNNRNRINVNDMTENELQPLQTFADKSNHVVMTQCINGDVNKPLFKSLSLECEIANKITNQDKPVNGNANGKIILLHSRQSNLRMSVSNPHISLSVGGHHKRGASLCASRAMDRADIFYQGSLLNIPEYRSRGDVSIKRRSHYGSMKSAHKNDDQSQDIEKVFGCVPCCTETRRTFYEMMNLSLFRDIIFIIFSVSNFFTSIGFNIPYLYIAAQAEVLGLTKGQASYLLAIIGIANTLSRIILGYISDKPWVNRLLVYNICLTACGIANALSIFCTDFITLAIYASVFGFTVGAYVGLTSVILVDLLGLDKLTNAFGLLLLFQGVASLVGPPIAGWLYDLTNSYDPAFLLAGVTVSASGLILFLIPPIKRHLEIKRKHQQEVSVVSS